MLGATALDSNLFSGRSIEEVALLIRDGGKKKGKKNGRIRRFFGRITRWVMKDEGRFKSLFVFFLLSYVIIFSNAFIAVNEFFNVTSVITVSVAIFSIVAIAIFIYVFSIMEKIIYEKFIIMNCVLFLFALVSQALFTGFWGWVVLSVVLSSFSVIGAILARQEKKIGQSLLVSKISSDEVVRILTEYVNDFISRNRELVVGADTEYGRHTADLKRRSAKIQSSINYWDERGRMEGVSPEYVERRLSLLRDLREKVDVELAQFETDSKETLLKLSALERQVPILQSEVNDHYQDLLIAEHEESLGILAEESRCITMEHISMMRAELLVAEQAISALRLKAAPALEGEGIIGELNARAEAVVSDISPDLVVVGA